jgi:hypothetical protein
MADTIHFKDLIAAGLAGAKSNTQFYLNAEKYRRAEAFKKDGFKTWEACLAKLIKKIRRSRSGVMAKMAQVRLLLDTKKVSFAQLEQMGDANATMLCRVHRVKGLSAAWIKRALTMDVEKFKAAVLKAVKPSEEPKRHLTFVVVQSLFVEVMSMIGRIQTLVKLNTKEGALDFIVADYLTKDDSEILQAAGEGSQLSERLERVRQQEASSTTKAKASRPRKSKDGSQSRVSTRPRGKRTSSRMESASTSSVSGTSSSASQVGASASSNAA